MFINLMIWNIQAWNGGKPIFITIDAFRRRSDDSWEFAIDIRKNLDDRNLTNR